MEISRQTASFLTASLAVLALALTIRYVAKKRSSSCQNAPHPINEAKIVRAKNILLVLPEVDQGSLLDELLKDFCGMVVTDISLVPSLSNMIVYLSGDISKSTSLPLHLAEQVYVVKELSHSFKGTSWPVVGIGRVPILVHGVGVYYRRFFDLNEDFFSWIRSEHDFQQLTESTKPGIAHRTGIYLTEVKEQGNEVHFRLLRCSSNFNGPTVNFGSSDQYVIKALNTEATNIFEDWAPVNHVLAQIYHNEPSVGDKKQTKAKIKGHSDKTKDMPADGIMAFCTFYDHLDRLHPMGSDPFDYGHKGISGLTKLVFRLKPCVANRPSCTLTSKFTVKLYPNSVFFMPLSTNRLYTHEIEPGALDIHLLPTRIGYVARCSATESVFKDGQTFLKTRLDKTVKLEPPSREGMKQLRSLYAEENSSDAVIDYARYGPILFSMNDGDYVKPLLDTVLPKFQSLQVVTDSNLFQQLSTSVKFETLGKGRKGTVLVKEDSVRGIPIVRTTTRYDYPAQHFQTLHQNLAQQIKKLASLPFDFNNALIESYTNLYTTMAYHSDQALDLEDGSSIALYSCYKDPDRVNRPRKLVVESKVPGQGSFDIPLTHNSVVIFSLKANQEFRHKIILESHSSFHDQEWLGITFRTSKTFVNFISGQARFEDGTPLTLATEEERRQFYKLRKLENEQTDFAYPVLTYTTSHSDIMEVEPPTDV